MQYVKLLHSITPFSLLQYASWDLAFHMLPFAKVDPEFAKQQLVLFLREWYMAPNGQIPGKTPTPPHSLANTVNVLPECHEMETSNLCHYITYCKVCL